MRIFRLNKIYSVVCNSENTRNGFRHTASVCNNGSSIYKTKCCYLNRTWERYEFQSVLHKAINGYFDEKTAKKYIKKLEKEPNPDLQGMKTTGMVASFANILCNTQEEKNNWKKRMLKAGMPELDMPADFDSLPEAEKQKRLDAVIAVTQE